MERKQFTFYQSYWRAASKMNKKDRLAVYDAITQYGLFGTLPEDLTPRQETVFCLIQPTLDNGRRKAENAMRGKGTPKTKQKQTENKKEIELEVENELEKELKNEIDIETESETDRGKAGGCVSTDFLFDDFWDMYPNKLDKYGAMDAWREVSPDQATYEKIRNSVEQWKSSLRWQNEGGRYIPTAASFLRRGYWQQPPAVATTTEEKEVKATCVMGQAEYDNIQSLLREG